ncbi:unnamed protein product [Caenorhabditis sp. 36 PRJEB53466]|nr:unnamed protein product [Caenorhabditis sp. 36 PRJEB53466]
MVREQPKDRSEEPVAKRGRIDEQPVEKREEEGEEEESELEEDSEVESNYDDVILTDEEEMDEGGEENEEVVVAPDAEDANPAVDEVAMNNMYDKVVRDAINIVPHRARSNGSVRSSGSVLRYDGINYLMAEMQGMWQERDEESYAERRQNLWPLLHDAIQQLRASGRVNHTNLLDQTVLPQDFLKDFEDAMELFLKTKKKEGTPQTWEETQARIKYETKRVKMLQSKAISFHKRNQTRPGWHHKYGALFPVQTSYDMIEFLMYAMSLTGFNFEKNLEENTVWHPEITELNDDGRRLMEACYIMDPSFRKEFIDTVKSMRVSAGGVLTAEEEKIATSLFDEMNAVFNLNFEHFILDDAAVIRHKKELARIRRVNLQRFRDLTAQANEAHRVLEEMMASRFRPA